MESSSERRPPAPIRALDALSEWTGRTVSWLTLALVLATALAVVLRYAFDFNSNALSETLTYLHVLVFMGGAAYTLKHGGHVRVDIFHSRFGPRAKAWAELLGVLLLLMPFCLFILWMCWDYVGQAWHIRERSTEPGGLPWVWLLKTLLLVMPALVLLQGLSDAGKNLLFLLGQAPDPNPERGGGH